MQNVAYGSAKSYSLNKYNNQLNDLNVHDNNEEKLRFQLNEVISKIDELEHVYISYVSRYRSTGDETILKQLSSLEASKRDLSNEKDICEKLLNDQKRLTRNNPSQEILRRSFNQFESIDRSGMQREFRQISDCGQYSEVFEDRNEEHNDISHRKDDISGYYSEKVKDMYQSFSNQKEVIDITNEHIGMTVNCDKEFSDRYKKFSDQGLYNDRVHSQEDIDVYYVGLKDRYNNFSNQEQVSNLTNRQRDTGDNFVEKFKDQISQIEFRHGELEQEYEDSNQKYDKHSYQEQVREKMYSQRSGADQWDEVISDKYKKGNNEEEFKKRHITNFNDKYVTNKNNFKMEITNDSNTVYHQKGNLKESHKGNFTHTPRPVLNANSYPDIWSMDVYSHISSRTLNKRKFVNPASLLGGSAAGFGQYNYTYFNDQPSEEVQIFEYCIESPTFDKNSAINNVSTSTNVTTTTTKTKPTFPINFVPSKPVSNVIGASTIVHINDIIARTEDTRHVIILRGLPGSGKSSFCQSFKDKEVVNGHGAPRILSIDPFFMDDGKYEYDASMEPTYLRELFKMFKRQIDEGFFNVILVDSINDKVEQFSQFYYYSKMNGFQTLILDLKVSPTICAKRCEHKLNPKEIYQLADRWEETPSDFMKLDANSFLQDSTIEDVEMEDATNDIIVLDSSGDEDEVLESGFFKSKWDEDFEETKERLDGRKHLGHEENVFNINDFLKLEEDEIYKSKVLAERGEEKTEVKRVKWADFEELKRQKKRKELGFVAGYTDWSKIMGDDIAVAEAALIHVRHYVKD